MVKMVLPFEAQHAFYTEGKCTSAAYWQETSGPKFI